MTAQSKCEPGTIRESSVGSDGKHCCGGKWPMVHKYGWNWGITRGLINRRFGTNYTADELKELYNER